jgi:hypothetical protein
MKPSLLLLSALLATATLAPGGFQTATLKAQTASEAPSTFPVGGLKFERPADWSWIPVQSPMRKAQLLVPGMDPKSGADITFFHFGAGGGGSVEENIQRWLRQFQNAGGAEKVEKKELGGKQVTLVSTEGTFSSGMPGGPSAPMAGYALLGAIVEDSEGNVFVKMTGPKVTVQAAKEKFIQFITSAKR